jgi:hypothetical protein
MRQLHPVGWQEKFVASGAYAFAIDGQPTGEIEQWAIHELPDGARLTRVELQHVEPNAFTLIEAWRPAGAKQSERVDMQAHRPNMPPRRASYHLAADRIDFALNEQHASVPIPDDTWLDAGALILRGAIIAQVGRVALASIGPREPVPDVTLVTIASGGVETVTLGAESYAARVYNVTGMGNDTCALWLDSHDVALRQTQGRLAIQLTQYVRRPEPRPS